MPEQTTPEQPRIALVFGDESATAHLREALVDHVEIVYATPAGEFDASRMSDARAAVALVNLDGDGWLDDIETKLDASGLAMVFNDSEISRHLEGWERARWLRHLVAKLRGSSDVDPPRPEAASQAAQPVLANADATPETPAPSADDAVAERPLSPEEIETMTADFVAAQETFPMHTTAHPSSDPVGPEAVQDANSLPAVELDFVDEPMAFSAQEMEPEAPARSSLATAGGAQAIASLPEPEHAEVDMEGGLDVDTEALSAMIDARLKETEASMPSNPPQVWRIVTGGAVSPVQLDAVVEADTAAEPDASSEAKHAGAWAPAAQDDADMLASLPSLDDWQLVDPEATATPSVANEARTSPEPVLSDAFAGVELVPLDTLAPSEVQTDPIERWFAGASVRAKADPSAAGQPAAKEPTHDRD